TKSATTAAAVLANSRTVGIARTRGSHACRRSAVTASSRDSKSVTTAIQRATDRTEVPTAAIRRATSGTASSVIRRECRARPPLAATLDIPLVVRDFAGADPLPGVNAGPPDDYQAPNHVDYELVSDEPCGLEDGVMPPGANCPSGMRIVRSGQGSTATGRG